jgi:hypothetical protein
VRRVVSRERLLAELPAASTVQHAVLREWPQAEWVLVSAAQQAVPPFAAVRARAPAHVPAEQPLVEQTAA